MVKQQWLLEHKASERAACSHTCRNRHGSHFLGGVGGVKERLVKRRNLPGNGHGK